MDSFEQPRAPRLNNEDRPHPDDVVPTGEVLPQIASETPTIMPEASATKILQPQTKSKKKVMLIILAVVLMFILIGGVVWFVLAKSVSRDGAGESGSGEVSETENGEDKNGESKKPVDNSESKNEIVELSIENKLVQKLYGYFGNHIGYLTYDFYNEDGGLSGNVDERMMVALAFDNMSLPSILLQTTTQDLGCYDAQPIREKVYEIFGKKIDFYDGMELLAEEYPLYTYSANNNAFCLVGGFSNTTSVHHNLYKVDKDDNRIYLYVVAGRIDTRGADSESGYYGTVYPVDLSDNEGFLYHPTGNDETDILEYAGKLDHFKWTFVKNGENYVFEKLERV